MVKKNLIFIPNWNGHLHLYDYNDNSVNKIYENFRTKINNKYNLFKVNVVKNNLKETDKNIKQEIELLNKSEKNIFITGDHSNTYFILKNLKKKLNKEIKLIIFDAHPDVEISDKKFISHEDYLRNLITKKIINPENIFILGIRTFSRKELDFLIKNEINYLTSENIIKNFKNSLNKLKKFVNDNKFEFYLSLDIDVLDPDFGPGTYYKEYCGLNYNELLNLINLLKDKINFLDITEYYEKEDIKNKTFNFIIKLIKYI